MYVVCGFFSGIIDYSRRYAVLLGLMTAVFCGHVVAQDAPLPVIFDTDMGVAKGVGVNQRDTQHWTDCCGVRRTAILRLAGGSW
jgi:hypothetical protein